MIHEMKLRLEYYEYIKMGTKRIFKNIRKILLKKRPRTLWSSWYKNREVMR